MNRTKPSLLTAILWLGCGDAEPEPIPVSDPFGPRIYEVVPEHDHAEYALYYDGSRAAFEIVKLIRTDYQSDDQHEVLAQLTPETIAVLNEEFDALTSGEISIGPLDP